MPIAAHRLQQWVTDLLTRWNYSPVDAEYLADTLVDANLRGVDSHGVIRLGAYRARLDAGLTSATAEPVLKGTGAALSVDANGAAGQIAARLAVTAARDAAREHGIAAVAIHGSTHFGAAGYYARALADDGLVAIVVSNSEPIVVPFGGRAPLFGTNPFAFAAPTSTTPISLDMATSTSAMGKVMVAQAEGRQVPADWGVDAGGNPTTDPHEITALVPAGGPKGYALGFLVEILGGVLTGAAITHGIGNMYNDFSRPQDVGHFMIAMDPTRFIPFDDFTARMDALSAEAHSVSPAPGFSEVLVPGEPEERTSRTRAETGIPLAAATVDELRALGADAGLPFPEEGE
ncbi:Ldh family oxidoreductase [Microbacterium pseudoresistens]|uniref:LDH2 family malate/lactate/ureidoglycolate dehydrogenase n=1 Tax=Microbacterium pseudoresistens TaxID=640634 RepID=A0A7Y9JKZ5_9MICO|nr:Ldh family oxidoreductase [Microbacterium pseudoresistens]NYD53137.1 LDH2 family malate/lactate/ureidoglycolate dehydrogenase [Microbacterium pseudoresistens]